MSTKQVPITAKKGHRVSMLCGSLLLMVILYLKYKQWGVLI